MPEGKTETLMEQSMPEGRTFRRFKKHIKPRHPPYAEMVQEALDLSSPSSYLPYGDLPSISYKCISSYILSKYAFDEEMDHYVLLTQAMKKLSRKGIVYYALPGRYVILPQFSSISAASYRPSPSNTFPPFPPPPPPPQHMEADTAEERGPALVPVDIKHFILLPNSPNSKIPCDPPPHYPPPLWELGS